MDKVVSQLRLNQWAQTVLDCSHRAHGISKNAWLDQHNIDRKRYYYWQRKVRQTAIWKTFGSDNEETDDLTDASVPAPGCFDITSQLNQVPEQVSVRSGTPPSVSFTSPVAMIQAGSYQVFINNGIDEQTLQTIMKVLSHA